MSQLLEFKTKPFEAIHFRQNARLVSTDTLVTEKHKALARRFAFAQGHQKSQNMDMNYVHKVNQAFSARTIQSVPGTVIRDTIRTSRSIAQQKLSASSSTEKVSVATDSVAYSSDMPGVYSEMASAYTQQRGSFEVRVAAGDLTYVPVIEMTIITSWPEVDFTYTGGFSYVPPRDEPSSSENMNLKI